VNAPVDETTVRNALLQLLSDRDGAAREEWISVRALQMSLDPSQTYVAVIVYPRAKALLVRELNHLTGAKEVMDDKTGVWVLSESQARALCETQQP
jgi:hypothetical protein